MILLNLCKDILAHCLEIGYDRMVSNPYSFFIYVIFPHNSTLCV